MSALKKKNVRNIGDNQFSKIKSLKQIVRTLSYVALINDTA